MLVAREQWYQAPARAPDPAEPPSGVTTKAEARQQCRASCHEEKLTPQFSLASLSWEGLNFTRKARGDEGGAHQTDDGGNIHLEAETDGALAR